LRAQIGALQSSVKIHLPLKGTKQTGTNKVVLMSPWPQQLKGQLRAKGINSAGVSEESRKRGGLN